MISILGERRRGVSKKTKKSTKKIKLRKKKENDREAPLASLNYAEELGPLLLLGRRSETGAGWLSDAGEYCGDTGEDCNHLFVCAT